MKKGFTLIELLVVIVIVAILAIMVVFVLNPAAILQQVRDSARISDMNTLNKAISLYYSDAINSPSTMFMGTSSVIYVSIPDPTATSTAGDQCQGLGFPVLPTGYTYQCAASSTYKNIDGTGWIPVNLNSYSAGSVISVLPIDPVNTSSTNLYYTYETDGIGGYKVTAFFESAKYAPQMASDGGNDSELYEKGSNLTLASGRGLIGYWPLNEGTGSTAQDFSGGGNIGNWSGTRLGTSGYYSPGKVGGFAGYFDGSTDSVISTSTMSNLSTNYTIVAWIYKNAYTAQEDFFSNRVGSGQVYFGMLGSNIFIYVNDASPASIVGGTVAIGQWQQLAAVATPSAMTFYLNGSAVYSNPWTDTGGGSGSAQLGYDPSAGNYWAGLIDDVRIYNRALSAAEIQEMYNATK